VTTKAVLALVVTKVTGPVLPSTVIGPEVNVPEEAVVTVSELGEVWVIVDWLANGTTVREYDQVPLSP
jgi:hypothetical protein